MDMGKAMIVAGIGSRKGVSAGEVVAAIDAALAAHKLGREALSALATTAFKQDEAGIFAAAKGLGLEIVVVDQEHNRPGDIAYAAKTPSPSRLRLDTSPPLREGEDKPAASSAPILHPALRGGGAERSEAEGGNQQADRTELTRSVDAVSLTYSALSPAVASTPSVSETAALIAAGPGASLLGRRIATGRVTCALAQSGEPR
jgi:cobalt-precorrin 5A hydrolase